MAKEINSDVFEIIPKKIYTAKEINWNDNFSRTTLEANNKSIRPEISKNLVDISKYDVIFVGFPICWYRAPNIINTFLESYDLKGKTIVPFATSGGSAMVETNVNLKSSIKEGF